MKLRFTLPRFFRSADGSITIMAAFAISLLVPASIAAVDVSSMYTTRDKMQRALDRALLAVARDSDLLATEDDGAISERTSILISNAAKLQRLRAKNIVVEASYDASADALSGSVTYKPHTHFGTRVVEVVQIEVSTTVTPPEIVKMEIALSLDVSGSMSWGLNTTAEAALGARRIDAMQEGVTALLEAFADQPRVDPRISVVPYSSSVDIRDIFANKTSSPGSVFKGAKGKTLGDHGLDAPPSQVSSTVTGWALKKSTSNGKQVMQGVWAGESAERNGAGNFKFKKNNPGQTRKIAIQSQTQIYTKCDATTVANWPDYVGDDGCVDMVDVEGGGQLPELNVFAPRSNILPLSAPESVATFMGNLEPEGGTAIHLGTEWALYSLLPEWHDMFAHPEGPPDELNTSTRKVLVVMTDGDLSTTQDPDMTIADGYDYLQEICTSARDMGVKVYAVGLQANATTDTELTECAGDSSRYFPVSSRTTIEEAFEDIAKDAVKLHISG